MGGACAAEREAARAQKLAAKRQKEAAHLLVAGKRDRRPSAKVRWRCC